MEKHSRYFIVFLLAAALAGYFGWRPNNGFAQSGKGAAAAPPRQQPESDSDKTPHHREKDRAPVLFDKAGLFDSQTIKMATEHFAENFGDVFLEPNVYYWAHFVPSPFDERTIPREAYIMVREYLYANLSERRTVELIENAMPVFFENYPKKKHLITEDSAN